VNGQRPREWRHSSRKSSRYRVEVVDESRDSGRAVRVIPGLLEEFGGFDTPEDVVLAQRQLPGEF
jgi:hypothetical protein